MRTTLTSIFLVSSLLISAQTLYVPSGTSGVGSSSNSNVGVGVGTPLSKLDVSGDIQISNASIPMGLMTEVGGVTPLLNLSLNFREPNKNTTYRGASIRLDSRTGSPLFQFLTRGAGTTTENIPFSIMENGYVGIGTTSPESKLVIDGIDNFTDGITIQNTWGYRNLITAYSDGANPTTGSALQFKIANNNSGGNTAVMTLRGSGNVGIGTINPNQKLTVNGTIYGKEVKVDLSVPGPDYVFEESYDLPSLEKVKSYIDQNKHLPEVPSAKEMEKVGINLSEMNMILLKKIEEVTLYLLEMKEENQRMKEKIETMNTKLNQIR